MEVLGSVLPSHVYNDPPETRRVAAAAVAGPLALSITARPFAEAVAARYGFRVTAVWLPLSPAQAAAQLPPGDAERLR